MALAGSAPDGQAIARILIEQGASTLVKDHQGRTWIEYMTRAIDEDGTDEGQEGLGEGYLDLLLEMMKAMNNELATNGQSILNWETIYGDSLLHAIVGDCTEDAILKNLLDFGFQVDRKNKSGNTALHLAMESAQYNGIELLLQRGASIGAQNNEGLTPMDIAEENMDDEHLAQLKDWRDQGKDFTTFTFEQEDDAEDGDAEESETQE
jgi:hypothetical protein